MTTTHNIAQIASQIEQIAQQANAKPPKNEQSTLIRVIHKILVLADYDLDRDVGFQVSSAAGRPDIAFPENPVFGTPSCERWWLEAKKWKTSSPDPVVQLLNYVNSQGGRWGILTNGHEWRLYDNRLLGKPADPLVVSTTLDEPYEMALFVEAISKDSFCTRQVETRAQRLKIYQDIRKLLNNPNGHPLTHTLAKHYGVSEQEIANIIKQVVQNHISPASAQASQVSASTNSAVSPAQQSAQTAAVPQVAPASSASPGPTPSMPSLPCPLKPTYRDWKTFYVAVVDWCDSQDSQKTIGILQDMKHYFQTPQFTPQTNFPATHPLPNNAGYFKTNLSSSHIQACVERFAQDFPQLRGCTVQITQKQRNGQPYPPWTIPLHP